MEKKKIETTVLFFDRKGFYKASQGKAPEQLAAELDSFYKEVIDAASAHQGKVVKFMGDAGLLLFDDPGDAVKFARKLLENPSYDSNVGIESGVVVHGTFGKQPLEWDDVIGEAVNEAAVNMGKAAKTGKIVLGPAAWEAIDDQSGEDLACSRDI